MNLDFILSVLTVTLPSNAFDTSSMKARRVSAIRGFLTSAGSKYWDSGGGYQIAIDISTKALKLFYLFFEPLHCPSKSIKISIRNWSRMCIRFPIVIQKIRLSFKNLQIRIKDVLETVII